MLFAMHLVPDNGAIQWMVERGRGNGLVTIKNMASGTFVSYDGEASRMKGIGLYPQPREWALRPGLDAGTF